jgi:hypothetical protein
LTLPSNYPKKKKIPKIFWVVLFGIPILIFGSATIINTMNQNTTNQNQPTASDLEKQAIQTVRNYKGTDNSGANVVETIAALVIAAYPNEDIIHNPSTTMGWDALSSATKGTRIYEVYFDFKTYKEKEEIFFYVEMNSSKIWAGNQVASDILNYVDTHE